MNRWHCGQHGCPSTAVGTGGAIGLRAIGWYFVRGPVLFCPVHRPDPTLDRVNLHDRETDDGTPCSACASEIEAQDHQVKMGAEPWTEVHRVVG